MLRYDTHVHMNELAADADAFIAQLDSGGMTGANVFSVPLPSYIFTKETAEYEERIHSLLALTQKYPIDCFPAFLSTRMKMAFSPKLKMPPVVAYLASK